MENKRIVIPASVAGEDKNATPAVIEALNILKGSKNATLCFEAGEYHFFREGSYEGFFAVSNNTSCQKHVIFPIIGFDGLTVDGEGASFIFHEVTFPFIVQGSKNITLKNITTDCAYSPVCVFTVKDRCEESFKLMFDKKKAPFIIENGSLSFIRELGVRSGIDKKYSLHAVDRIGVLYLFTGDCTDEKRGLAAPYMHVDAEEIEGGVLLTYRKETNCKCGFWEGETISTIVDGGREVDVIFLDDSDNIKVQNVTVRQGIGMGVIAQICRDIEIDNFSTDVDYHGGVSTLTADSLHFVNCSGKLDIHNCHISHTMDDVINVHGMYTVLQDIGDDKIIAKISHHEQKHVNIYRSGDPLDILDPKTFKSIAQFEVTSSRFIDDEETEIELCGYFSRGAESAACGCLIENSLKIAKVHIHRNRFHKYPRILALGSGDIVIENNHLSHSVSALRCAVAPDYWYESGGLKNLIFRNNIVDDCNAMGGSAFISAGVEGFTDTNTPKLHKRFEISGNVFKNVKKHVIKVAGIEELVVKDNIFETDAEELLVVDGQVEDINKFN